MASVTRSPYLNRDHRRGDVTERLIAAAGELLAEGAGFTEISVEQVITRAEVSRSTFYVYFEDKSALLLAMVKDAMRDLLRAVGVWFELEGEIDRGRLRAVLAEIATTYRRHGRLMAAVNEAAAYDERARAELDLAVQFAIDGVAAVIREGQAAGAVRTGLEPETTAACLAWATERVLDKLVRPATGDADIERFVDGMTDVIWHTLYLAASE